MSSTLSHSVESSAPDRTLFTVDEVAGIFRVTPRTVRRWAADGTIERIRIGGTARFTAHAVDSLIAVHNDHAPAGGERVGKAGNDDAHPKP
jgi:excisionase family DNA binding protein